MRFDPRVRAIAIVVAAAAAGLGAEPAVATAAAPRQTGSITWTSKRPAHAAGLVLDFRFRNPSGAKRKPYSVARLVVRSPAGARIDTSVPPQCHATDAELLAEGWAACPRATQVGHAVAESDTGSGGPFPRYTRTHIRNFNNRAEIIGVGVNDDLPVIRSVDHTRIAGRTSTTNFPVFPGQPPPDPFVAFRSLHIELRRYTRGRRTYIRTPRRCPSRGYWTITAVFTYHDGVSQVLRSHSPCRAGSVRRY